MQARKILGFTFDAVGTLIRPRRSVGEVYSELAGQYGVRCAAEELETRFGAALTTAPPLCFPSAPREALERCEKEWWRNVVRRTFGGLLFPRFEAFFEHLYGTFAEPTQWESYDDVLPTLSALQVAGFRLGIVSNFDSRLYGILRGLALASYFDVVVVSSSVGAAKPDPAIFQCALDRFALAPAQVCHVGDREYEDVEGARRAGLRALRIDRGAGERLGEGCLTDLEELLAALPG